jgi:hypothetical protein
MPTPARDAITIGAAKHNAASWKYAVIALSVKLDEAPASLYRGSK